MPPQTQFLSKEDWAKKYWFNSLQMVTVVNPKAEDWPFMVEMRHFIIKAGSKERFPGVIANVYLDQMAKIMAQDDDRLGFMADPTLKAQYYDKLIVDVESLVNEIDTSVPNYLKDVPKTAIMQPEERAPWTENMERSSDIAPMPPVVVPEQPKVETPVKAETKEFELEGTKYKLVVSKDGREMFYKDGKMTNAAEYAKAASML